MINDWFYPPIPEFDSEEMDMLPGFDFAITQERIGGGAETTTDPLSIVTQRVIDSTS